MAQPDYAPTEARDRVRRFVPLAQKGQRELSRPGEGRILDPLRRFSGYSAPGPDAGYGLRLAERVVAEKGAPPGLGHEDSVWAVSVLALKRAAHLGRAPIKKDAEMAYSLLITLLKEQAQRGGRAPVLNLRGISESYGTQRRLASLISIEALQGAAETQRALEGLEGGDLVEHG